MVDKWLIESMIEYNSESLIHKESYAGVLHIPGKLFSKLLNWTFQSLPDEILIGIDIDSKKPHKEEVDLLFMGSEHVKNLFAGQGYVIGEAEIVNRGDSYSVHHLPEEWTDGIFETTRGVRGGRFIHWLHTHPNAPALPSRPDAEASQETLGVDMILGVRFSPEGPLPWIENLNDIDENTRRKLSQGKKVIGIARTGHLIHGLEIIAFHRTGLGINVIFVDNEGYPYGWPFIEE